MITNESISNLRTAREHHHHLLSKVTVLIMYQEALSEIQGHTSGLSMLSCGYMYIYFTTWSL